MTTREERLQAILEPSTTAVLTMELQNGVVGEGALMGALVDELARTGTLDTVRRLCTGARDAGARVVHCTVVARPDGAGSTENCKIFAMSAKQRREHGSTATDVGSRGAELIDGLEDPRDIVVPRMHGMTPFTSTSLDQILRNLGVRTVVATGVSVNLGVFGHGAHRARPRLPGRDPHRRGGGRAARVRRRGPRALALAHLDAHHHRRGARGLGVTSDRSRLPGRSTG